MKILLMGGAGYLGIPFSKYLADRDHEVTILDKFLYTNETFIDLQRIKIIKDDVCNIDQYHEIIKTFDIIYYLISPRLNEIDEEYQIYEPIKFLSKTIDIINQNTRFIYISSCSVYGETKEVVNEMSPTKITSLYSKLKIESEKLILSRGNSNFKIVRLSTLYGVSQFIRNDILINQLVGDYKKNQIIKIFDPNSTRPHLHVNDCIHVLYNLFVDDHLRYEKVPRIINIGHKLLNITKREIANTIKLIVKNVTIKNIDSEDSRSYYVDFSELENIFRFQPITFEDGIKELIAYEPIYASLENWDTVLDFYLPNGASKSWYLNETGKIDYPKNFGIWNLVDIENNFKFLDKTRIHNDIILNFRNQVHYLTESKLKNKKHLYIINIWDFDFFERNLNIGFNCISETYINDVKQNRCAIVMIHQFEGNSGSSVKNLDLEIINSWIEKLNLPHENVHYIHGNLLIDEVRKLKNLKFKCHPLSIFDSWIDHRQITEIIDYKPCDEKNLFLTYNRRARSHRIYLVNQLIKHNLYDRGKVSLGYFGFKIGYTTTTFFEKYNNLDEKELQELSNKTPIEIDRTLDINWATNIEIKDYEETFLSIVTETLIDESVLFVSEKIWKPIVIGHPFIILGNLGTLQYLKSLGFKTFDKWIDESYDNEPYEQIRINKIIQEIKKFENKKIDELITIRKEMKEVCEHNRNWFIEMKKTKYNYDDNFEFDNVKPILDILKKIYKNLN